MERSIVSFQEYTSAASWRRPEQLRGLLRNHPDVIATSGPLAAPGNVFSSAKIALHDSGAAMAVAMSPFIGAGSVGLMPIGDTPSLDAAAHMRWLDLTDDLKTSSVEWFGDLLLLGSSRGRVIVADLGLDACTEGNSVLEPCGVLMTSAAEAPLSEVTVSPGSYAATTVVRSVRANPRVNRASVLATRGNEAFLWDLNGDALPVRAWSPHRSAESRSVVLFACWAPASDSVVLTGSYDGQLVLTDTRYAGANNGLAFAFRERYMASCADFNTVMPFVFAAASSDGVFCIFDVRYHTQPVLTVPSLQGDVASMQWLRSQSDMLVTGGTDGSVSMWNLRKPPTYCVGRAQYKLPVTALATTETFLEQRAFGMTVGGELTLTGLRKEAMMTLAPALEAVDAAEGDAPAGGDDGGSGSGGGAALSQAGESTANMFPATGAAATARAALEEKERTACGLLYTRRLREGYAALCECASERFAMKDTTRAMQLVSLIDVNRVPSIDYTDLLRTWRDAAQAAQPSQPAPNAEGTLDAVEARRAFEIQLQRTTSHLCTTVPLDRIKDLRKPDPQDLRKLEALRLNTLLHRALATQHPDRVVSGVRQAMDLLSAHPESFELIDGTVVSGIVSLLLRRRFSEGERFVRALLSLLEDATGSGSPAAVALFRQVLSTVQEPLVTGGLATRAAHRYTEAFFRDLSAAKAAVLVQLEIQRLGVERHRDVIATVNAYLSRCHERRVPDMFSWLGVQPVILFLHCLTADSNYVTFFWTCVQCIEAWAAFPLVRQIEAVLFEVVGRIHAAATKIEEDLDDLADVERFSVPLLRQADNTLRSAHDFLAVLLRVQFECENVVLRSGMGEMPPVMAKIEDVLNTASEDVLDAWSGVVDALIACDQTDLVRKFCFTTVRDFSFRVEELMDVSAKGDSDERLNEILDVCDDFMDSISKRR